MCTREPVCRASMTSRATMVSSAMPGHPGRPSRPDSSPSWQQAAGPARCGSWACWETTPPKARTYSSARRMSRESVTHRPSSEKTLTRARDRAISPSSASSSPARALLTAPTGWTSTRLAARPRSRTRSAASAVSVTGVVLAIASTAVKPPTAAAADPEAMVSASSRPGSRRCVWRSTRPGSATSPSASRTSAPRVERRAPTSVITPSSMRRSWRPLPARSAPVISSALTGSSLLLRAGGRGPTSARPPPRRPARG